MPGSLGFLPQCQEESLLGILFHIVGKIHRLKTYWVHIWVTRKGRRKNTQGTLYLDVVAQSLGHVQLFENPWTAAYQTSLSFTISQSLLKLMSIESMIPHNNFILFYPLLSLASVLSSIRVFSNESALHIKWPEYWSFSFGMSPYNEYSGLISFRMDRCDLLAVPGTLKSLLQHHSSKVSILWHSAFFMVQLSHPYMTTRKTTALTTQTFVGKVMLCFLIHCLGLS